MELQLIRNATMKFDYAGKHFIVDPDLAPKHSRPSFTGKSPNPMVDLPCPLEEVIARLEMMVVSHVHRDHFDAVAQEQLPKTIPVYCQPEDQHFIQNKEFWTAIPIVDEAKFQGITIQRVPGQHGSGPVLQDMGTVSGFVFSAPNEPTVYWTGDTIWYQSVAEVIQRTQPDIILTHSCGAVWGKQNTLIVMDAEQTVQVCRAAPNSTVVAVHMEALDHSTVTRADLRNYADAHGVGPEKLLIPEDGEKISF